MLCTCSVFSGSWALTSLLRRRSRYGEMRSRSTTAHLYAVVTWHGKAVSHVHAMSVACTMTRRFITTDRTCVERMGILVRQSKAIVLNCKSQRFYGRYAS